MLRELSEEEAENQHRQEGLQDRPGGADDGLFVTDFNLAPDKEVERAREIPIIRRTAAPTNGWEA